MQKTLTVTIDEDVYNGLYETVAPQDINHFVEELIRPYVTQRDLESAYKQMAQETQREEEALHWAELSCKDIANEEG